MSQVRIEPLSRSRADVARFLRVAEMIYTGDPNWVAPLNFDQQQVFSERNPFFEHAEMQLWIARKGDREAGRIAGILDRAFKNPAGRSTVFFGYFEARPDPSVSAALFDTAGQWAAARGGTHLVGPMNPSINDECGLLIEGYDSPPALMMPYNPAYYPGLYTGAGFTKAKDLLAFWLDPAAAPLERIQRLAGQVHQRHPELRIVLVRKSNLREILPKLQEIYNEAWEQNWGAIPMTGAEITFLADRLRPLLTEGLALIAETNHEPAGFLLALPDFNEVLRPLKGSLLSPALLRALPYLLKWKVPRLCRLLVLGVKSKFRGRGIETALLAEALPAGLRLGFTGVEASWILEDNVRVQRLIHLFGGRVYKRYRIYERSLARQGAEESGSVAGAASR